MKISKKVREEAALICAIAASNGEETEQAYATVADLLGISRRQGGHETASETLAYEAWVVCRDSDHPDAEAEALLRTGWSPGGEP